MPLQEFPSQQETRQPEFTDHEPRAAQLVSRHHLTALKTNTESHAFDLKEKIPYHSLSDDDREKYWDDGLHLAPDGYDWMGDHIADYLIPVIQREEQTEPAGSITKAPARGTARPSNAPPSTSADDQAEPVTPKPKRLHEGDFQPPKPKAKKVAPAAELGDTPDIEEEGGSTRNISQGYVVVRKHDLH